MSDRKIPSSHCSGIVISCLAMLLLAWSSTAAVGQGLWSPDPNGNNAVAGIQGIGSAVMTVAWDDARNGAADIYAQGVSPSSGAALWTSNGVPISTAPNRQARISMPTASSFIAGAILVWEDDRNGATMTDIAKVATDGVLPVTLQRVGVE